MSSLVTFTNLSTPTMTRMGGVGRGGILTAESGVKSGEASAVVRTSLLDGSGICLRYTTVFLKTKFAKHGLQLDLFRIHLVLVGVRIIIVNSSGSN